MINLLSPDTKQNIRAARRNVRLRLFTILGTAVVLSMVAIYGIGFYLVLGERAVAERQLSQDKEAAGAYDSVLAQAKQYKANLAIANKVLSTGMNYSNFLTTTAQTLPAGSVLTTLTLTNLGTPSAIVGTSANTIALQARTTSYGGALVLKDSLERSDTFENVSLSDVKRTELTNESTTLQKKYPYEVGINVGISKPKIGQ